jgi:hypothetical protein
LRGDGNRTLSLVNDAGRPHLFGLLAGLFLATGLVLSAMVLTRAWLRVSESQVISVTGAAAKEVVADLIVWRGSFAVDGTNLIQAQERWAADLAKVETFFKSRNASNYVLKPLRIIELKSAPTPENRETRTVGFRMTQELEITSTNIAEIQRMAPETIALVQQGVFFSAAAPEFVYTQAAEVKIQMLAEATKDAQERGNQIASQGGRRLGKLRSARMGVFQITRPHSTETSWEGVNDTSSYEKTVRSVVSATFSLE